MTIGLTEIMRREELKDTEEKQIKPVFDDACYHVPNIRARYRAWPEFLGFADGSAEQGPLAVALDACRFDISAELSFQLVVARHFIDLAVFLAQAQPPAFFLREVILEGERDDGTDTGEGVGHHRDDGAIAQPHHR
jgi:hypothetical protein